jgi:hypothetical protein
MCNRNLKTLANAAPVKKEQAPQVNSGYYAFKSHLLNYTHVSPSLWGHSYSSKHLVHKQANCESTKTGKTKCFAQEQTNYIGSHAFICAEIYQQTTYIGIKNFILMDMVQTAILLINFASYSAFNWYTHCPHFSGQIPELSFPPKMSMASSWKSMG